MRAERTHGTLEGFDVFVDVHIQNMPIIHKNKSIIGLILKTMETRVMEFQVWGYKASYNLIMFFFGYLAILDCDSAVQC